MKDKHGREIDYLRLSVTDNCNLRCIYCMDEEGNKFLESSKKLSDDEIIKIVEVCAKLGIKKVRITGGEPLVRKGIVDLIGRINNVEGIEEIYLTTNGILFSDMVKELSQNGVKGVNISLDSLKADRFKALTRNGDLSKVTEAIDKAIHYGLKVKLNTVIVNDINKDEILDFVKLTLDKRIDVRFIELMPMGKGSVYKGISNSTILEMIKEAYGDVAEEVKTLKGGPATYIKITGAKGRVGFISAISNCFCEECNRIRVTPDGFLKQCLHYDYGINLRDLMRNGISEIELQEVIENNIYNKPEKHMFNKVDSNKEIRFMNQIGG